MIDKDTIRDLILKQCDICLHLYGKIPPGGMDFRPTPGQRSTLELLRYLAICAISGTRAMVEGDWSAYHEAAARVADMPAESFPEEMQRQKDEIAACFDGLDPDELGTRTAKTPIGEELPVEQALVELPLAWMVAYRMQLFLYAKQAGNADLWTPNCWAGVDWEKPVPEEVAAGAEGEPGAGS